MHVYRPAYVNADASDHVRRYARCSLMHRGLGEGVPGCTLQVAGGVSSPRSSSQLYA